MMAAGAQANEIVISITCRRPAGGSGSECDSRGRGQLSMRLGELLAGAARQPMRGRRLASACAPDLSRQCRPRTKRRRPCARDTRRTSSRPTNADVQRLPHQSCTHPAMMMMITLPSIDAAMLRLAVSINRFQGTEQTKNTSVLRFSTSTRLIYTAWCIGTLVDSLVYIYSH
jgi:hypothetical protein